MEFDSDDNFLYRLRVIYTGGCWSGKNYFVAEFDGEIKVIETP